MRKGFVDINPSTGDVVVLGPGGVDGVSVSPDGKTAYGEYGGNSVIRYSITTLLNPALLTTDADYYIIVADGGTRGDLVAADNSTGTSFFDQYETVQRLACGAGCVISSQPVPEPMTLGLLGAAFIGTHLARRKSG